MSELRQRQPRMVDLGFLAFLRKKSCLNCLAPPPVEAAHIRMACIEIGKRETGKQEKPDDRWALPLCSWCHRYSPQSQHNIGEDVFWARRNINPFIFASAHYQTYGGDGGKPQRRRTTIKPRLPKTQRRTISKGKRPWPKRLLSSKKT